MGLVQTFTTIVGTVMQGTSAEGTRSRVIFLLLCALVVCAQIKQSQCGHGVPLETMEVCCRLIELYIRTRGRTGDAACTNATGQQGDTRAILYAH